LFLAKVIGNVWATRKIPALNEKRLLLVQKMDTLSGSTTGDVMLAVCFKIDAGIGDTVLVCDEGSSANQHMGTPPTPIRTFIFAVVDQVYSEGRTTIYT